MSCITLICDYGSETWYHGQKSFENQFQVLQNLMIRKILETFKTSPVQAMEIEVNLLPAKLRLIPKNQKYAVRIAKIGQFNLIGQRIPMDFSTQFESTGFDTYQKFAN